MMNKKPSDQGTTRASSRDRASYRKSAPLPLDAEAAATLSLKEKLLLLHFHEKEPSEGDNTEAAGTETETETELDAGLRNRKRFERSITAPVLPLNHCSTSIPEEVTVKKRSDTLPCSTDQSQTSTMPNRKRSEQGTVTTTARIKQQQRHVHNVKQIIGGCCCKLKKGVNWGTASTTTSGSGRSGSGSG